MNQEKTITIKTEEKQSNILNNKDTKPNKLSSLITKSKTEHQLKPPKSMGKFSLLEKKKKKKKKSRKRILLQID